VIVRPSGDVVQLVTSGQVRQARPNVAARFRRGRIETICPAGQVTVAAARSIAKSSFVK
jgi:hypothetical protein